MIISLVFDMVSGFFLHRLRPWTLTFRGHQGTLLRYAIGMIAFCVMAPVNIAIRLGGVWEKLYPLRELRHWLYLIDVIFVGLLDTAVALGSGVLIGFLSDANKNENGNGNGKSIR